MLADVGVFRNPCPSPAGFRRGARSTARGGVRLIYLTSLLLLSGCWRAAPESTLARDQVRFDRGVVAVELTEGHPFHRIELRDESGFSLLTQPVVPGEPLAFPFEYDWRPRERLFLRASGDGQPGRELAMEAPPSLPPPVRVSLEFPAGVETPPAERLLLLPVGAEGTAALVVRSLVEGLLRVRVTLHLPEFFQPAQQPDRRSVRESPLQRTFLLSGRGDTGRLEASFRVAAAGGGPLEWEVAVEGEKRPLGGSQAIKAVPPAALRAGLALSDSVFPVDRRGDSLPHLPRERITLARQGLGWLPGWLARPRDPFQPVGFARIGVENRLNGNVIVILGTRVVEREGGPPLPDFRNPLLGGGVEQVRELRSVPAGGISSFLQPVFLNDSRGRPGRFLRCVEVLPWGSEEGGRESCSELRVVRSSLAGWVVVWLIAALGLAVFLGGLATLPRWIRRFPLGDLVLIALMAASAILLASVPGFFARAVAQIFLGPFSFLVHGLFFNLLLLLLLGCLFALVPRPGVYFLFYGLWMVAQAVLAGHYTPMVLLFGGITVIAIESGLWLGGITRPARGGPSASPWFGVVVVGIAEALAVFASIQLLKVLFRIYLADWFILLQAGSEGLYAALGLAVGLRLGSRLRQIRRPSLWKSARDSAALLGTAATGVSNIPDSALPRAGALLEVRGLTFTYPGASGPILTGLDLSLNPGEVVLVAGRSGAGKTTLLRLVQGLLPEPPGAQILFRARPARAHSPKAWARRCGLLFQEPTLQVVRPTVGSEVAFGIETLSDKALEREAEIRNTVAETLATFGLSGLAGRATTRLSGGELQRTALAALLVTEPPLLMLDEPLAHLDEPSRADLLERLGRLARKGVALLIAEHRTELLLPLAQRVVWLEEGRVAWEGKPADFRRSRYARRPALPASLGQPRPAPREAPFPARSEETGPYPLVFQDVHFRRPESAGPVLQRVTGTLRPGAAVALSGHNGAGKSTLLELLLGLHRPASGAVTVAGRPAHRLGWRRRSRWFGYLPQQADSILQAPTVAEELVFALRNQGRTETVAGVGLRLERLGLQGLGERFPHLLSRGERQRLALGAVMIADPLVLLLDEPFAGQDPDQVGAILALCAAFLAENERRSLVVASHDLAPVMGFFDETWHLERGRLTVTSRPELPAEPRRAAMGGR